MSKFEEVLISQGFTPCPNCAKYSHAGKTFLIDDDSFKGIYWYYETDSFMIDVHDFFIKKEKVFDSFPDVRPFMSFVSSYMKAANGEWFHPYQPLSSHTMFIMNAGSSNVRFLLHGKGPFQSVGVNFKDKMIEEYLIDSLNMDSHQVSDIFFETRDFITKPIEKLSDSILNCSMSIPSAELFFEAKAKEWLSITLEEYMKLKNAKPLSRPDQISIENVADYINDHYTLDISQKLLEEISMMSGTKLKNSFKQKYQMSITEFTQRKRMNMAEILLLTTDIGIGDVAKSVGYSSHSRFSTLFKKYKGLYPSEVKKHQTSSNNICTCKGPRETNGKTASSSVTLFELETVVGEEQIAKPFPKLTS